MWMCKLQLHTVNNTDLTDTCYRPPCTFPLNRPYRYNFTESAMLITVLPIYGRIQRTSSLRPADSVASSKNYIWSKNSYLNVREKAAVSPHFFTCFLIFHTINWNRVSYSVDTYSCCNLSECNRVTIENKYFHNIKRIFIDHHQIWVIETFIRK